MLATGEIKIPYLLFFKMFLLICRLIDDRTQTFMVPGILEYEVQFLKRK